MPTISDFLSRLRILLQDPAQVFYTDADLTEAIRQALMEYSRLLPQTRSIIITGYTSRELSINAIAHDPQLIHVIQVWWPYVEGQEPPVNHVNGFRLEWVSGRPYIVIETAPHRIPQSSDQVRIGYQIPHAIQDLDGYVETTLPAHHEHILLAGAAGYAARAASTSRTEPGTQVLLEAYARTALIDFQTKLAEEQASAARNQAVPWTKPWKMDKWHRIY